MRNSEFEHGLSEKAIMTEPENFEEDLFADLYVVRITSDALP